MSAVLIGAKALANPSKVGGVVMVVLAIVLLLVGGTLLAVGVGKTPTDSGLVTGGAVTLTIGLLLGAVGLWLALRKTTDSNVTLARKEQLAASVAPGVGTAYDETSRIKAADGMSDSVAAYLGNDAANEPLYADYESPESSVDASEASAAPAPLPSQPRAPITLADAAKNIAKRAAQDPNNIAFLRQQQARLPASVQQAIATAEQVAPQVQKFVAQNPELRQLVEQNLAK